MRDERETIVVAPHQDSEDVESVGRDSRRLPAQQDATTSSPDDGRHQEVCGLREQAKKTQRKGYNTTSSRSVSAPSPPVKPWAGLKKVPPPATTCPCDRKRANWTTAAKMDPRQGRKPTRSMTGAIAAGRVTLRGIGKNRGPGSFLSSPASPAPAVVPPSRLHGLAKKEPPKSQNESIVFPNTLPKSISR